VPGFSRFLEHLEDLSVRGASQAKFRVLYAE
jgi:hypothetical protein